MFCYSNWPEDKLLGNSLAAINQTRFLLLLVMCLYLTDIVLELTRLVNNFIQKTLKRFWCQAKYY